MKIPFALLVAAIQLPGDILAFSPTPLVTKRRSSTTTANTQLLSTTSSLDDSLTSSTANEAKAKAHKIRPLHQNWFPVSITTALKPDRPNAIELLSQKLVLYHDGGDWKCLADRCSHRFAPLSEGRLISSRNSGIADEETSSSSSSACTSCSIQCAYHGWEFDSTGKCTNVPQYPSSSPKKAQSVPSFPVREESGMIWVWADPDKSTWDKAESISLPISPLVKRAYKNYGADACFMRDLPYGMELLGENLLDLSHLPFSHHSVGGLDRELGGELPLRMMSEKERTEYAKWEEEFLDDNGTTYDVPLHQAEVLNASDTDPIFLVIANRFPSGVSESANATIAFFEPCHVRYRRERLPGSVGHVELFMCPTSAGRSRVFLWNTIHKAEEPPVTKTLKSRLVKLSPLAAMKKAVLAKLMNPATVRAHSVAHLIFDGDGIFLHYQGNRMYENDLTFRDYSTPSSSDVLLNAYRRYLDSAAKLSTKAAAKTVSYQSGAAYGGNVSRSKMLDRYNSHTKNCKICLEELERNEKQRDVVNICKTALVGTGGASTAALIAALFPGRVLPVAAARAAAISIVASVFAFTGMSKKEAALEKKIQSFKFEDYIHAEKNESNGSVKRTLN